MGGKQDSYLLEVHPFDDFISSDTERLIIGSFPTHKKNRQFEFYYGGDSNHFWSIVAEIFQVKFDRRKGESAIKERKQFARRHKIGFTDMLEMCYRRNDFSGDEHLYPVKWKDITVILEDYPSIRTLIFTSRTKAIGALGLFKTLLLQKGIKEPVFEEYKGVLEGNFQVSGRDIEILVPSSPSNRSVERREEKVTKMYGYALNGWKI